MPGKKFEAVVVLSSARTDAKGKFKDVDADKTGKEIYLGGASRMQAAVEAFKQNPKAAFIMLGGIDVLNNGELFYKTGQMAEFMKQHCQGINIQAIDSLPCTRHNLIALGNSALLGAYKRVGLLSNDYHEARIEAFLESLRHRENVVMPDLQFVSPRDFGVSEGVEQSDKKYQERIRLEANGVAHIEQHPSQYHDSCLEGKVDELNFRLGREAVSKMLTPLERVRFLHEGFDGKKL